MKKFTRPPRAVAGDLAPVKRGLFKSRDGTVWVKSYNDLPNSKALGKFKRKESAMAHAVFLDFLRKKRVFHPQTRFIVAQGSDGKPTVVSLMPALREGSFTGKRLLDRLRYKQDLVLRVVEEELGNPFFAAHDVDYEFNYGISRNGRVFLVDLHVLDKAQKEVMAWYAKRKLKTRLLRLLE